MKIIENAPLAELNTFSAPATATGLVNAKTLADLFDALSWAQERHLPVIPLGAGSNIVLGEQINALVLHPELKGIEVIEENEASVRLRVAAGENWHSLVTWTLEQEYFGLENLALIPGLVGAAPIQNIGAYGVELSSFVANVQFIDTVNSETSLLSTAHCRFGYRDSIFKHELRDRVIVTGLEIVLGKQPVVRTDYPALRAYLDSSGQNGPDPHDVFNAVVSIRQAKLPDPATEPNAGSFFKNPLVSESDAVALAKQFPQLPVYPQADNQVKLAAAWMIEHCGWKGRRRGGVGVHPNHALVLVNYDHRNGETLLALAREIAADVLSTFGLQLEIEPRIYGL